MGYYPPNDPPNRKSRVIPAYVKAENPYTGELPDEAIGENYKRLQSNWFDTLRAKGHDAWIPSSQGGDLVVALKEPHQIKSIYNNGKFDPNQKHMNKARGGAVEFMRDNHPLVPDELYHGNALQVAKKGWTDEIDFEGTQRNMEGQNFKEFKPSAYGNYGPGIYMTDKPEVASDFAQGIRADRKEAMPFGQVIKLHASIKQPFHDEYLKNPAWVDYIKQALTKHSIAPHEKTQRDAILQKLDDGTATVRDLFLSDTPDGTMVNQFGQNEIHDTIRRSGFDGIIAHHPNGSKEYVAFKPEQVKSALSARKFDPTSPDMTYADGGAAMFEGMHEDLQNEDGTPMDLWHGTPGEGFSEFKDEKLGSRDAGFYGRGHYLTPMRGNAEDYADPDEMGGGTVMGPLHAALKNPYVWDMSSGDGVHRTLRDLQSMGIMKGKSNLDPWDNLQRHHIDPFMREMQKRGHDGVVVRMPDMQGDRPHKVTEVVVFKPTAIKHKDAERFDPNDPNIYHARGGVAK
jgi:hypothetical protein